MLQRVKKMRFGLPLKLKCRVLTRKKHDIEPTFTLCLLFLRFLIEPKVTAFVVFFPQNLQISKLAKFSCLLLI